MSEIECEESYVEPADAFELQAPNKKAAAVTAA